MDLNAYIEILLRRKVIIAAAVVLSTTVATVITLAMTPIYSASALLRVAPPMLGSVDYTEMVHAERINNTFIKMLNSWPVMDTVANRVGVPREGLEKKIRIELVRDTELIRITVEDPNRDTAKSIAAAIADLAMEQSQRPIGGRTAQDMLAEKLASMQKEITNARLEAASLEAATSTLDQSISAIKLRTLEETYGTLLREYEQARIREAIRANSVSIIEPPGASGLPVRPNMRQNVALGAVLGILAGVGLAFVAESMKKTIRTTEDLERELNVNVLGTLPKFRAKSEFPELLMGNSTSSYQTVEHFRLLRASLQAAVNEKQLKTLLFTSAGPGEGKSTIVVNLAVAAANANQRIVVVDADFRRASIHKVFGLSNGEGLAQTLRGEKEIQSLLRSTGFEGLRVLTSGPNPSNPDGLLDPAAVKLVLAELMQMFDLVFFDGPPALLVADASLIAPLFDGIVVVTKYDHTSSNELRRIVSQLKNVNANVVGTVLNSYQPHGNAYYYNKYYRSAPDDQGV